MRNPVGDRADDVRAFLGRMADEAPTPPPSRRVVRRARRRVLATAVGAALTLALLTVGSAAALDAVRAWNRTVPAEETPTPGPSEAAVTVVGRFGEDDLERLTLGPRERPPGAGLRYDESGFASASTVGSSLYVPIERLEAAGFVQSYYSLFLNEHWWDTSAPPRDRLDLVSWAILFEDADAARAGLEGFSEGPTGAIELRRWRSEPIRGLGDEASVSRGVLEGLRTISYVWRVDNVVLFLGSQGALPADTMLELVARLDARAS